jgi:hypothetical protein
MLIPVDRCAIGRRQIGDRDKGAAEHRAQPDQGRRSARLGSTSERLMRDEPRISQIILPVRDDQTFSNASIAATTVICALAGFAPVTMRPLVMEKASKGTGGAI